MEREREIELFLTVFLSQFVTCNFPFKLSFNYNVTDVF